MNCEHDAIKNLLPALEQLSNASKRILADVNIEGMAQASKIVSETMKSMRVPDRRLVYEASGLKTYSNLQLMVSEVFMKNLIQSGTLQGLSEIQVKQMANLQSSVSLIANLFNETTLLRELEKNLASVNISGCLNAVQKSIGSGEICMPDIFFFKTTDVLKVLEAGLKIPRRLRSDIKGLNKSSAIRLAANNNITFVRDEGVFVNDFNTAAKSSVSEMNVICGAKEVLDRAASEQEAVSENELMDFMSFLDEHPMLAMRHEAGRKIYDIIKNFSNIINFDKKYYYHCRARNKEDAPYVRSQLKSAPHGITSSGRYNHAGQSYFYFADTKEGAETEIRKHMSQKDKDEKVLQTVQISHKGDVKLIDLSGKSLRGLNTFLRYIRFSLADDKSNRPRVYLIPSFVSDCCADCGFDGIKYYGGKDYSNYVTWKDCYYDFVHDV